MRILIADGSKTVRNLIASILAEAGFRHVIQARDGAEAYAYITAGRVDVAVLDWHLPRLSGFEILTSTRAEGSHIPIVMMSMDTPMSTVCAALRAGVDEIIAKPFKSEVLVGKILNVATIRRNAAAGWRSSDISSISRMRPSTQSRALFN